jgi:hypothetical protein
MSRARVSEIGALTIFLALVLTQPAFARDTPTTPVGPQIRTAVGVASLLSLRDLIIDEGVSPWANVSLSYRGFSISGWGSASDSGKGQASEAFISYSYKLPLLDLHAGLVRTSVNSMELRSMTAVRITLSTNVSTRIAADASIDHEIGEGDAVVTSLALTSAILQAREWNVDARVSATSWEAERNSADGWTVRAIAARQLKDHSRLVIYLGYGDTRDHATSGRSSRNALIAGVSISLR